MVRAVGLLTLLLVTAADAQINNPSNVIFQGPATVGHCVDIAAVGPPVVLQDAGAPCGSGGGGCQGAMDLSAGCALLVAGYGGLF